MICSFLRTGGSKTLAFIAEGRKITRKLGLIGGVGGVSFNNGTAWHHLELGVSHSKVPGLDTPDSLDSWYTIGSHCPPKPTVPLWCHVDAWMFFYWGIYLPPFNVSQICEIFMTFPCFIFVLCLVSPSLQKLNPNADDIQWSKHYFAFYLDTQSIKWHRVNQLMYLETVSIGIVFSFWHAEQKKKNFWTWICDTIFLPEQFVNLEGPTLGLPWPSWEFKVIKSSIPTVN